MLDIGTFSFLTPPFKVRPLLSIIALLSQKMDWTTILGYVVGSGWTRIELAAGETKHYYAYYNKKNQNKGVAHRPFWGFDNTGSFRVENINVRMTSLTVPDNPGAGRIFFEIHNYNDTQFIGSFYFLIFEITDDSIKLVEEE